VSPNGAQPSGHGGGPSCTTTRLDSLSHTSRELIWSAARTCSTAHSPAPVDAAVRQREGELESGQGNFGSTTALSAIAVVVIGGTALLGSEGSMWRTGIGLPIIGTLSNVFFSLALSANWQTVVTGVILILAVAFDVLIRTGRRT